jgi:predicted SprT family Zn-dependent metalloprotease
MRYAVLDNSKNDKIILQIKQEGETFYYDQCDYQTGRKGDLRKHRQSKHEGVRYACGKCEY